MPPYLTSWRRILILPSHLYVVLQSGLFPSGLPRTKTLCACYCNLILHGRQEDDCLTRLYRRLSCTCMQVAIWLVYLGDCLTRVYRRLSYTCIQETVIHVYTGECLTRVYRRLSYACIEENVLHVYTGDSHTRVYRTVLHVCTGDSHVYTVDCHIHVYRRLSYSCIQVIWHVYTRGCITSVYRRLSCTCIQETDCITHINRRQAILRLQTVMSKRNRL